MLDIKFIRTNPDLVKKVIKDKNISNLDISELLKVDQELLDTRRCLEDLQHQRNTNAQEVKSAQNSEKELFIKKGKEIATKINEIKPKMTSLEEVLQGFLLRVPNIPCEETPIGKNEGDNVVIKVVGERAKFSFDPLDHVEILEKHGWADFKRIPIISGNRNYALKNDALLLEQAILNFTMELLINKGFDLMSVPSFVREAALIGTGHFPSGRDQVYFLQNDDIYLSGTAEVPLNSLYSGEILDAKDLPLRIAGFSPCFRREAGNAGKDVRGLIRVHQFLKVEQFVICKNDVAESDKWHKFLLNVSEEILNLLEIPYQIVECCTGDMGVGKYRMFDIESWVPSEEKYRETHSCSCLHDWQARRANLRYRDENGEVKYCHTLNNTAIASPRILVPFLENHQQQDGTVRIPKVLQKYLGNRKYIGA